MAKFDYPFETVEEVVEYLQNYSYNLTDKFNKDLKEIEIYRMKKFLPKDEKYNIYIGSDKVVAIFATENEIQYIWQTRYKNNFGYEAMTIDNEEIANAIADYPQYIKNGGCFDVSKWLFEEYCDTMLSIDYEVLTTIGRIWN